MKPIENSNLKDWSCIRRISGQIRLEEKRLIYVEKWKWEIESSKRVAQEIAKKLRSYEESVAKKQTEPDIWELMSCLCIKREIPWLWFNCWLRFRIYRRRWIPWPMQENFTILRQRAALDHPTFPANPRIFRVPEECLAAILDCRSIHGIPSVPQDTFFESLPGREGPSSALFESSRNLASSSCGLTSGNTMEHGRVVRWDPQSSSIPTPRFNQGVATLNPLSYTGGTYFQNGMMDYPRYPISELHLGKIPGLHGLSKLGSPLQDWSMFRDSRSSSHNVLDQRSWGSKVNGRFYDIAIDYRA